MIDFRRPLNGIKLLDDITTSGGRNNRTASQQNKHLRLKYNRTEPTTLHFQCMGPS